MDMEELTSAEIASRVGKEQRTIQRWLKSGKLPAIPLADNRYGVNTHDLERLARPEHVSESDKEVLEIMQIQSPLEEKVEYLQLQIDDLTSQLYGAERKIERLEYRLNQVLKETRENTKKKTPARRSPRKKWKRLRRGEISLDSILPIDLVSLAAFAEEHRIPWSAVSKAIRGYELFVERGIWKDGWRTVKVAIDERGRATFYDLFHLHTRFKSCEDCPHKWW